MAKLEDPRLANARLRVSNTVPATKFMFPRCGSLCHRQNGKGFSAAAGWIR